MVQQIIPPDPPAGSSPPDELITTCHIIYALFAVGIFLHGIPLLFGIPPLAIIVYFVGALMAYSRRKEAEGTWLDSHFALITRLFWVTVVVSVLVTIGFWSGIMLSFGSILAGASGALLGTLLLTLCAFFGGVAYVVWFVWLTAAGWLRLAERRPAA